MLIAVYEKNSSVICCHFRHTFVPYSRTCSLLASSTGVSSAHRYRRLFLVLPARGVCRILVRGSVHCCCLKRRKFRKFDYEMVHSEVYLNKYVVSISPFSTPACPDCSQDFQKTALFCMFLLFNFSSIFPGWSQLAPFAPMCGRPCYPHSMQSKVRAFVCLSVCRKLCYCGLAGGDIYGLAGGVNEGSAPLSAYVVAEHRLVHFAVTTA